MKKEVKEGSILYDAHMATQYLNYGCDKLYAICENSYDKIYPWTNECLSTYYDLYDLENKNALTVTSSSDHAMHAILAGCKSVDSFDKNKLSKYYADLKIALIKTLTYDEFMNFYKDKSFFENLDLQTLSYNLSDNTKEFWQEFYNNSKSKRRYKLFKNDGYVDPVKSDIKYLDEDQYYKLKNNLYDANITYYDSDIRTLEKNKLYDVIFLSNILDFYGTKERKSILNICSNLLNEEGIIYVYNKLKLFSKTEIDELILDKKILTKKIPKSGKYESVLVYKKR